MLNRLALSYTDSVENAEREERKKTSVQKMFDCAIDIVERKGIDSLSASEIVKQAGVSRPTFYSHFGDTDGLLAEFWLDRYKLWLLEICDPTNLVVAQSPESRTLVETFLVAHRKPQIDEAIESTMPGFLEDTFPLLADRTVALWTFANRLGVIASKDVWPITERASFLESYLDCARGKVTYLEPLEAEDLPSVAAPSDPNDHQRLIGATIQIVQKSGVNGLSVARLGRMLRVTSAYIYPRIDTPEELVAEAFDIALMQATTSNIGRWRKKNRGIESFVEYLVGGLGDPRANWRQFRGEVLLVARHSHTLSEATRTSLDVFVGSVTKQVSLLPVPRSISRDLAVLVHTLLFGFSAIHSSGINVQNLAHTGIIRAMLAELGGRIFRGEKIR